MKSAIAVSVILFPGLISTVIADKITVHSKNWDSFKYGIYSFVFGVFCYVIVQILSWLMTYIPERLNILPLRAETLAVWSIVTDNRARIDLREVFAATVFPYQ
jgi:MFS superfamily sulfate permease-like transporter